MQSHRVRNRIEHLCAITVVLSLGIVFRRNWFPTSRSHGWKRKSRVAPDAFCILFLLRAFSFSSLATFISSCPASLLILFSIYHHQELIPLWAPAPSGRPPLIFSTSCFCCSVSEGSSFSCRAVSFCNFVSESLLKALELLDGVFSLLLLS